MWFVLNYVPGPGFKRLNLPNIIRTFNKSADTNLELFAPTFVTLSSETGKVQRVEKPLLFHYIFLKGDESAIKRLCHSFEGFSFVMDHTGTTRHLLIDDYTLEQFRIIARYYGNKLPCLPLDEINLEEGDKVQIVTGELAGLSGTYINRKGGKSGNILIAVSQNLGAVLYDVKADYVRVLEFAKDTRRSYDQIDAYIPRLLSLLQPPSPEGEGPGVRLAPVTIFTRRLGSVKLHNAKLDAKLQLLLYASYTLLGDKANATFALTKYNNLKEKVTNVWTRALCHLILGLLNGDPEELAAARALISGTEGASVITGTKGAPRLSALQSQIYNLVNPRSPGRAQYG